MFRKKTKPPEVEKIIIPMVKSVPKEIVSGNPTKNREGTNVMTAILTGGVDTPPRFSWMGAIPTFGSVAFLGFSGYTFDDGDCGIDGFLATEHPLSRAARQELSISVREWGASNGDLYFSHTWINERFFSKDATLSLSVLLSHVVGTEPKELCTAGALFHEEWGKSLVPSL